MAMSSVSVVLLVVGVASAARVAGTDRSNARGSTSNRREMVQFMATTPSIAPSMAPAAAPLGSPPNLPLFVEALTIPPQIPVPASGSVSLGAYRVKQRFHPNLPPTTIYGIGTSEADASTPGPTIVAKRGVPATIRWGNYINDTVHMMPIDHTLGVGALHLPGVPISMHLHGAVVPSFFDGHPDAWYTSGGVSGPAYTSMEHVYPNQQTGTTLWYHDHTAGMTRLNVAAGLTGLYFLTDDKEASLNLPTGAYDIPLLLQDKSFDKRTGDILFPKRGVTPTHPVWEPEYFGDYLLVNGRVSPYLNVSNTVYRFRIVNGANARFFDLTTDPPMNFSQIASDSDFLSQPISRSRMLIGPGERVEVLMDFGGLLAGTEVVLKNSAPYPYSDGDVPVSQNLTEVMKFVVGSGVAAKVATVPPSLAPTFFQLNPADASVNRTINVTEKESAANGEPETSLLEGLRWMDPATVTPLEGGTEVWTIINLTEDWHTFHIHLIPHQLVQRQAFDREKYLAGQCSVDASNSTASSCFTGPVELPPVDELSWKDTTQVPSGFVTTLIIRFQSLDNSSLPFDSTQGPGYVFHCHILDHEDNDMMRPFIMGKSQQSQQGTTATPAHKAGERLQFSLGARVAGLLSLLVLLL